MAHALQQFFVLVFANLLSPLLDHASHTLRITILSVGPVPGGATGEPRFLATAAEVCSAPDGGGKLKTDAHFPCSPAMPTDNKINFGYGPL